MEVKEHTAEAAIKVPVATASTPSVAPATTVKTAVRPAESTRKQPRRGRTGGNGTAASPEHPAAQSSLPASAPGRGSLPERWLVDGLSLVKGQARRRDLVGQAAYRYLEVVHGGLEMAVRTLTRIERASAPPSRIAASPTRPAARRPAGLRRAGRRASARLRRAG